MDEINNSILEKENVIFITKLINETAIKSNVQITSFLPVSSSKSGKLCKVSNQGSSRSRRRNKEPIRKGAFQSNFYEINLKSDYLNMIEFLSVIQHYNVTIIPQCLEVSLIKQQQNSSIKDKNLSDNDPTIIVPITKSGEPINSSNNNFNINSTIDHGQVASRLVLQIPSHSR